MTPEDTVPNSLHFPYSNWRRGFEKRDPMKKLVEMSFVTKHRLQASDLEDTIDKATQLLQPYRGFIATIEIVKTILVVLGLLLFCILAIVIGWSSANWLWCAFVIVLYIAITITAVYFTKYLYNAKLWQSNFLLSVFCRAENNRHYLVLGLELRPGFLGKWIEIKVLDTVKHPDVISYFKQRFLQPAIDLRTKNAEKSMFRDPELLRQQKKIEAQIDSKKKAHLKNQNLYEQREVH